MGGIIGTGNRLQYRLKLLEIQQLMQNVLERDSHWIWQGKVNKHGYGKAYCRGRDEYAHRLFYLAFRGWIGTGDDIHHRCRVKLCCNPYHLQKEDHYKHAAINHRECDTGEDTVPF